MAKFKHLSKDKMDHVIDRIGEIRSALDGLAVLFYNHDGDVVPNRNEVHGIGDIIKGQSRALASLDDILRDGRDNRAVTEDWQKPKYID